MTFSILNLWQLILFSSSADAITPISVKGTKLYDSGGSQFFVKGVSYIAGDGRSDPLVNTTQCQTDATLMSRANINTIYVYTVDHAQDHDGCMKAFADHGIYVWLQLGVFASATGQAGGPQWTFSVYAAWTVVVETFAGYDNVLALGIGQETITDNATSTVIAPALKAAARDLHAFCAARGYRPIPLSYSAADVSLFRVATAQYLTCGEDDSATIDLLGLNIFLDCSEPAWSTLHAQLGSLPIPVVISEAGCRPAGSGERNFAEVARILSQDYHDVLSGVNVFEWAMRDSGFGVVQYADSAHAGEPETLAQFDALASVFDAARPTGTPREAYTPSNAAPTCPTSDAAQGWLVDADAPLPTIQGLQIDAVTVRTTVTGANSPGSSVTGDDGKGQAAGSSSGDSNDGLSAGAIAGIVAGAVIGLLLLLVGALLCLRRKRTAAPAEELPPNYGYPSSNVELPAHAMAAFEMDAEPYTAAASPAAWKIPIQSTADGAPMLAELPDRKWKRTTYYELDNGHLGRGGESFRA